MTNFWKALTYVLLGLLLACLALGLVGVEKVMVNPVLEPKPVVSTSNADYLASNGNSL